MLAVNLFNKFLLRFFWIINLIGILYHMKFIRYGIRILSSDCSECIYNRAD